MKFSKYILPNALTSFNILCGTTAIIFLFESQLDYPYVPVVLIGIAALFDLLDGLAAKLLGATSEFGKQLDSLADLISFGLAPSYMMYKLFNLSFTYRSTASTFHIETASIAERLIMYTALLLVLFAAFRLARYNIADSDKRNFQGLPVPASALFIISIWIEFHLTENTTMQAVILHPGVLLSLVVLLSFLMVSKIEMLSLKSRGTGFAANKWQYFLIAGSIILYILNGVSALIFIMFYYILLSAVKNIIDRQSM
jgi:CDP-diacylglycerol--serine O-phosphatidyltransferase